MTQPTGFYAHKGGQWQRGILPTPAPDSVITFPFFRMNTGNVGGFFNPATSRFQPDAGIYQTDLSINVANPTDGGKYYALIRKNGEPNTNENLSKAFELLRSCRPRIPGADTVGTAVSGMLFANGTDYFEAVIQGSNTNSSFDLGGQAYETYWSAFRIGDYVEQPAQPAGSVLIEPAATVASYSGNYTVFDRGLALPRGAIISKLEIYNVQGARTLKFKIAAVNGAGMDVLYSGSFVHAGNGWDGPSLSFTVPAAVCYAGAYNAILGPHDVSAITAARMFKTGDQSALGVTSWTTDTGYVWPMRYVS